MEPWEPSKLKDLGLSGMLHHYVLDMTDVQRKDLAAKGKAEGKLGGIKPGPAAAKSKPDLWESRDEASEASAGSAAVGKAAGTPPEGGASAGAASAAAVGFEGSGCRVCDLGLALGRAAAPQ